MTEGAHKLRVSKPVGSAQEQVDAQSCYLFKPEPDRTVSWSGSCRDGIASGSGG